MGGGGVLQLLVHYGESESWLSTNRNESNQTFCLASLVPTVEASNVTDSFDDP